MPFTPFHFGPSAVVALPLGRRLDLPVFVLASVVIDLEPLAVMLLGLKYPLHGYLHTLLFGALAGAVWGWFAWYGRRWLSALMSWMRLPYAPSRVRMVVSGILGAWFHVLLDAPLYLDIRPFFPLDANPLLGIIGMTELYLTCAMTFILALAIYPAVRVRTK